MLQIFGDIKMHIPERKYRSNADVICSHMTKQKPFNTTGTVWWFDGKVKCILAKNANIIKGHYGHFIWQTENRQRINVKRISKTGFEVSHT